MQALDPFFIYKISTAAGDQVHSSILYAEIDPANPPSAEDLREHILIAASYAGNEHEWPEHGHEDKKDLIISLFGPFMPGAPADELTTAEFHAIDECDLP